jgi:hypothetical protein
LGYSFQTERGGQDWDPVKGGQDGRATYAVDVYGREDLSDRGERGGQLQSLEKEKGEKEKRSLVVVER